MRRLRMAFVAVGILAIAAFVLWVGYYALEELMLGPRGSRADAPKGLSFRSGVLPWVPVEGTKALR
jgi:hypothetical protein